MKKALALLISLTLVTGMLTGCGNNEEKETTATPTTAPATTEEKTEETTTETTTEATAAKTGLAVITSLGKSKVPGEKDGLAQVDSTIVAVLVGQDGKILKCAIDAAQTKINFSAEGKIVSDITVEGQTKQELKEGYGMVKNSSIGKEWYEQANALAAYVVGKTVDEVKNIAIDAEGVATDADLVASVTVGIDGYIAAIEKAVANAQDLGASATDKLGLGVATSISGSKDATADAEGLAQAYTHYTVITTDADGKITSSILDASQGKVNFNATGVISTDLAVGPQTKQELGDAYGMKAKSGLGKEWYEQANAFATYVTGKTLDEVNGIALNEEGNATDADLLASVTVHVIDFVKVINKAVANAQ